jgi:hypothetical protein
VGTGGLSIRKAGAPVSIGTIIRQQQPKLVRHKDGATLHGTDFLDPVECQGVTDFCVGKSALMSPAYFVGTFLGNLARSFEKYRWNKLRVHYVPKVSTATSGQIVMTSSHSVSEPVLNPNSGTFLQRAMAQGNATMGPLWMENYIDIDCDGEWKLVDPATTSDPDDAIAEELQIFTQCEQAQQVGYLYAEYEVEFCNTIFQPHSSYIPIYTGPGVRAVLTDTAAINAVGDDWNVSDPTNALAIANINNGTIYRAVLDIAGSAAGTGTTLANMSNVGLSTRLTTITTSMAVSPLPLVGGMTFYIVLIGTGFAVYTSVEAAINGSGSGQVFYRTASTGVGSYAFDCALIRYGGAILPTTQ